jgi:hypothetical protein
MKNRDWEERLLEGPYDVRANQIQIQNIRERVLNAGEKRKHFGLSWTMPIVLLFGMLFCVWIFNVPFQSPKQEVASTFTNDDILQIIDQSNPNPEREILYKENVGDNDQLIFTKIMNTERKGMTWEVGYIDGVSESWISGGEIWVDFVTRTQLEEGLKEGYKNIIPMYIGAKEYTPFPIIYGPLTNPRISQIRITGENDFQQIVKVIRHIHGGFSLWYAYLPDAMNTSFDIEFMDAEGNIIEIYNAIVDSNGVLTLLNAARTEQ